ncbi:MAG: MarR family transcriptional regulator [Minwuiales bacterium]|nr:MarR family transcriptional regulator [Minwuiales bacterium]
MSDDQDLQAILRRRITVDGCMCFNLRKASRAVTQVYDEFLRSGGLRTTQFSLLAMLVGKGPMPIRTLADYMVMDRTTLTRNLKLVEREGLVTVRAGEDRRTRIVEITEKGRNAIRHALPFWQEAQDFMVRELGSKTWAALQANLGDTISAAQTTND